MKTPFFETLSKYLKDRRSGPSFIQGVLDCPLEDAIALNRETCVSKRYLVDTNAYVRIARHSDCVLGTQGECGIVDAVGNHQ